MPGDNNKNNATLTLCILPAHCYQIVEKNVLSQSLNKNIRVLAFPKMLGIAVQQRI
jgi:hypothetical protein